MSNFKFVQLSGRKIDAWAYNDYKMKLTRAFLSDEYIERQKLKINENSCVWFVNRDERCQIR